MKIEYIYGREVLDSRGNPTVEAEVGLDNGIIERAIVPSGASTGEKEAVELRDGNENRFHGKGVLKAVKNVNQIIAPAIIRSELTVFEQVAIDNLMISLDGTTNKSKLGANAILAVSLAIAKTAALCSHMPLYQYLGGPNAKQMPVPMLNIINGGDHATNSIDFQEFMIVPIGAKSITSAIQISSEIYHSLMQKLKKNKFSTGVGDEGGFAPNLKNAEEALELMVESIKDAGYNPSRSGNKAVALALDVAASELYIKSGQNKGKYYFKKQSAFLQKEIIKTTEEMIKHYEHLVEKFPIISIEDGLGEHDWNGMIEMTKRLGNKIQIVGDDIFVTNPEIIAEGIKKKAANSVLIKLNQIGTLTETFDAIEMVQKAGWTPVISHRSGETEDTTIADLAVATNAGQIKTGSVARTDRIAKYNQLIRINDHLGNIAIYSADKSFYNIGNSN